jgi:hypothetical protein
MFCNQQEKLNIIIFVCEMWNMTSELFCEIAGFICDLEKLEKPGKVMESENRPKSHGKSWKFKENLEKSWNLPPSQKLKMIKLNIPPHIPWRSAYCIFYLNEGVILLIFKYFHPLIFCKTHGNFLEKSWNFIPGKVYKSWIGPWCLYLFNWPKSCILTIMELFFYCLWCR